MFRKITHILKQERGQSLAEYGLIIALIALGVLVAIKFLGGAVAQKFKDTGEQIQNAQPY